MNQATATATATKETTCSSFGDLYYACLLKVHEDSQGVNRSQQGVDQCQQIFVSWTLCRQMCRRPDEKCQRFKDIIVAKTEHRPRPRPWAGAVE